MISTTGEYALRAAVFLAQHHPDPQTTAQIAAATKVPSGYLSKILQAMVRREVIHSQRGLHGGFTLVQDPKDTAVLNILAAVDAEPQRIRKCPLGLRGHVKLCPLHRLVDEAIEHVQKTFSKTNLGELSQSVEGSLPLCEDNILVKVTRSKK